MTATLNKDISKAQKLIDGIENCLDLATLRTPQEGLIESLQSYAPKFISHLPNPDKGTFVYIEGDLANPDPTDPLIILAQEIYNQFSFLKCGSSFTSTNATFNDSFLDTCKELVGSEWEFWAADDLQEYCASALVIDHCIAADYSYSFEDGFLTFTTNEGTTVCVCVYSTEMGISDLAFPVSYAKLFKMLEAVQPYADLASTQEPELADDKWINSFLVAQVLMAWEANFTELITYKDEDKAHALVLCSKEEAARLMQEKPEARLMGTRNEDLD